MQIQLVKILPVWGTQLLMKPHLLNMLQQPPVLLRTHLHLTHMYPCSIHQRLRPNAGPLCPLAAGIEAETMYLQKDALLSIVSKPEHDKRECACQCINNKLSVEHTACSLKPSKTMCKVTTRPLSLLHQHDQAYSQLNDKQHLQAQWRSIIAHNHARLHNVCDTITLWIQAFHQALHISASLGTCM